VIICGLLLVGTRLRDLLQDADENLPRFQRRTLHLAGLGAGLLAAAWLALLAGPFMNNRRAAGLPSVIIVSIDTLRADRMGVLGATPSRTPLLDDLAGEGTLFTQAQAAAPWTLPSHASLFTSLLPFDHHVRWSWMRIAPDHALLAEHFRAAGYRTAAFTGGGYVAGHFGFDQGFQIYEDHDEIEEGGPETIADNALRWVRQTGGQPYFLFVHTYEPHSPFLHPDPGSPATDPGRLAAGVTFQEVDAIHSGEMVLTEDERRHVINLYNGDVAHADRVVGGFLQTLRAEGRLDDTILVVLSDHGEDLWDHSDVRSPGHGHNLYQELMHVPLMVRAPGRVPGGHRLQTPVSLLDVAPTLLALAGLPPDPHHRGRSLETALLTATEPSQVPVLAESVEYGPDRFMRREGDLKVVLTPTPGIVHNNVRLHVAPLEIFDLAGDPGEHHNLVAGAEDELAASARTLVMELRERARLKLFGEETLPGEEQRLPPELEEQLRSLGYIQ
jgi:arylsulfatase A-like enzyme